MWCILLVPLVLTWAIPLSSAFAFPPPGLLSLACSSPGANRFSFPGGGVLSLTCSSSPVGAGTSMTFGHTYRFPSIPYSEGVRHIHTLEHLQNISARRASESNGSPYFRIESVAQPVRYGEYVSVAAHCRVMGLPQTVCMLSRPGMENTSTYMCLRDGVQMAMIQLKVSELGARGHTLAVETTYFSRRRLLDSALEPVMRFLRFFESSRHRKPGVVLHPNLMWYRRMVMGLIGKEGVMGLE